MSSATNGGHHEPGKRFSSIARSISWSYWWRRLLNWIMLDALILLGCYSCWHVSGLAAHSVDAFIATAGTDFGAFASFAEPFLPVAGFIVLWELIDLLNVFSETRRVRRKLQPLNDLAIMADTLAQAGVADPMSASADKMATLEQAISQASVDSPTVTTGDKDLRSIEVALNNLLRQMQEAKLQQMRFVNDASHELRTPIAVIQGYVNMLDRWGKTDEKVLDESIEALKLESDHMQELVEQLLFLARGDSGRNTLQRAQVNIASVVREVWEESLMIDKTHAYRCSITDAQAADPRYVAIGDLAMIKQSMRIIVQNAEKYSPDGTAITLSVVEQDGRVGYAVQDEGIGMSQKDAAHAFERFYRADSARSETTEGSGLGLAIAKWIVDAHNGTIDVISREGVGTRFTVLFPR